MASLLTVRIDKGNSPNLGFRLQGGKDFGTPLVIQKVNGGSPAERAGLIAGDSVVKINNVDVYNLRHKDAQDVVVRAGPSFELTIQRGGSTWKPSVTPTGPIYSPGSNINNVNPVTRTSLAAKHTDNFGSVGTGHNLSAKPFAPQVNGAVNGGPKVVNKQYNSPLKLYSEESIAETLSAQTEVLSTGALGVNFKKNERNYDASNSEVLRALKEAENEPNYQDQVIRSDFYSTQSHAIGGRKSTTPKPNPIEQTRTIAVDTSEQGVTPKPPPEGATICSDCERVIVGVFVRIKEKNLHVECFKCSTCGSSLKNVGYYNINNKLYCDVHAKSAALKNQPNSNLVPITVPPGGKAPAHAISSALSSHSYPTPSPLSPKINSAGPTYPAEETKENVDVLSSLPILAKSNTSNNNLYSSSAPLSFNNYINKASNFSAPKPFSHIGAPLSPQNTLPRTGPLSPVAPAPAPSFNHSYTPSAYSPSSGRFPTHKKPAGGLFKVQVAENIIWPPPQNDPEIPTACPLFYPPPSQIEQKIIEKRKLKEEQESEDTEYCFELEEINRMAHFVPKVPPEYRSGRTSEEVKESLTETLNTQILVENISKTRVTPMQLEERDYPRIDEHRAKPAELAKHCPRSLPDDLCCGIKDNCELKTSVDFTSKPSECPVHHRDLPVPLKWESPMTQAIRTTSPDKDTFACIPTKHSSSSLATALSVAPSEPFTPASANVDPVPLPEETVPYFPPERPILPEKGSDAPAPPIRKKFGPADKLLEDLPKPEGKLRMLDALTTAPERSYSPFIEQMSTEAETKEVKVKQQKSNLHRPTRPDVLPESFGMHRKQPQPPGYYHPSVHFESTEEIQREEKLEESSVTKETVQKQEESNIVQTTTVQKHTVENPGSQTIADENQNKLQTAPMFHGFSCSFQNKGDISQFSVDVRTSSPVLSPPPCTPTISVTNQPTCVRTETITESRSEKQKQLTKKEEEKKTARREEKVTLKPAIKQSEEVIPIKPQPQAALHKPTQLPQYQVELSAEAESELLLLEKKRQAELRIERQKQESSARQEVKAPVIKIETEENPSTTFRPVVEEHPPSQSFSPRHGSSTPSRIGSKPPAILPYYQVNLVPQYMEATHSNLFDPKSPAVSRSPSPNPVANRERSPSPLPESKSNIRPTSPAQGPPENPLKEPQSLPNPASIKVDRARESLKEYIPEYKSRRDYIEATRGETPQMYTSVVKSQNYPAYPPQEQSFNYQQAEFLEAAKSETNIQQQGDTFVSTSMQEQLRQAHLGQSKKSQSQSVERSADGSTQIQRKTTVTEEFERTQRQVNVQIEKNVTSTKKYPFTDVNVPSIEASNARGRLTDPQRMSSSFLKSGCTKIEDCLKQQMQSQSAAQPPSGPAASASHQHGLNASAAKSVLPPKTPNVSSVSSQPDAGATSGRQTGGVRIAPRRGRGILNPAAIGGARIPLCGSCNMQVRGPFITALGKIWCPSHFICATQSCRRPLQDVGFVEEHGQLYCEYCFEQYLAPACSKCGGKIKGDCLKAIGKNFHPECFSCSYCGKLFGNSSFFLEDGSPYCEADWNELFTTKCFACAFPIEAGDRWVEALNNNYHSQCFNCTMCKKNLEGQSFFAKGGRPFCKNHAR